MRSYDVLLNLSLDTMLEVDYVSSKLMKHIKTFKIKVSFFFFQDIQRPCFYSFQWKLSGWNEINQEFACVTFGIHYHSGCPRVDFPFSLKKLQEQKPAAHWRKFETVAWPQLRWRSSRSRKLSQKSVSSKLHANITYRGYLWSYLYFEKDDAKNGL